MYVPLWQDVQEQEGDENPPDSKWLSATEYTGTTHS